MEKELIGLSEFSRRHEIAISTIQNLIQREIIPIEIVEGRRMILEPEASEAYNMHKSRHAVGESDINHWKLKNEKYKAEKNRIEFETASGKLVEKASVEKEAFECAKVVRDSLLSIPDRVCHELSAETNPHVIRSKLDHEITLALKNLSKLGTPAKEEEKKSGRPKGAKNKGSSTSKKQKKDSTKEDKK